MEHLEVVRSRHSVRSYKADEVEEEKLSAILEAAVQAPTAANKQPFRVIVMKTKGREAELKKVYGRDWFVQAPLVLAVCSVPNDAWVRGDGKNYGDVDAAIVMDHIILTATSLGLGTCWVGAFDPLEAKAVFNLDPAWEPVVLTPLGYEAEGGRRKTTRKSSGELVVYRY